MPCQPTGGCQPPLRHHPPVFNLPSSAVRLLPLHPYLCFFCAWCAACRSFKYLVLDDCWSQRPREKGEKLQADKQKFPSGMKVWYHTMLHRRGIAGQQADAFACTVCGRNVAARPCCLEHQALHTKQPAQGGPTTTAGTELVPTP
jgi:hypothetical protein